MDKLISIPRDLNTILKMHSVRLGQSATLTIRSLVRKRLSAEDLTKDPEPLQNKVVAFSDKEVEGLEKVSKLKGLPVKNVVELWIREETQKLNERPQDDLLS